MAKNEQTSKAMGKLASKIMRGNYSRTAKRLAGSVLTQRPDRKKR
jgi:hypothetical protein